MTHLPPGMPPSTAEYTTSLIDESVKIDEADREEKEIVEEFLSFEEEIVAQGEAMAMQAWNDAAFSAQAYEGDERLCCSRDDHM